MRPWLSFDVETSGQKEEFALQPWRVKSGQAWITTFALTLRDERGILLTKGKILQQGDKVEPGWTYDELIDVLRLAKKMRARIVGWNMTFDMAWLAAYALKFDDDDQVLWRLMLDCEWLDAMRLWRHLDSTPTYAGKRTWRLDEANKLFEKAYAAYKQVGAELYHDPRPEARARLLTYNKGDTEATLLHTERFWPQLTEQQQRCAIIEASAMPHVAKANVYGQVIDVEARAILSATLREAGHEVARVMAPLGVKEVVIRSPAKMADLLYKKWGLPIIKRNNPSAKEIEKAEIEGRDPVGTPSTDKEVLHELGLDDKRVFNLQLWRDAINMNSKFMGGLQRSIEYNEEGNISYPQCNIYGTYTGRCTYNSTQGTKKLPVGYALHQMKRDERFRNCVKAPEGYTLVEFDAAGQEFRWMAIKSGDETMLALCETGGDPHSYMTAAIYHWDYVETKRLAKDKTTREAKGRKLGKVANLSLQYRTSKRKLRVVARVQYGLPMTEDEAEHVHSTYLRTYPNVPRYWKSQRTLAIQQGWIDTLAGRRVQIVGDWNGDYDWAMQSTAINFPIQGTGGDQKYLAVRCLKNIIAEYGAIFAWDLHDGLYFYVPHNRAPAFIDAARAVLDALPYKEAWGFVSPIPLPWDCKWGPSWGQLKEVEA